MSVKSSVICIVMALIGRLSFAGRKHEGLDNLIFCALLFNCLFSCSSTCLVIKKSRSHNLRKHRQGPSQNFHDLIGLATGFYLDWPLIGVKYESQMVKIQCSLEKMWSEDNLVCLYPNPVSMITAGDLV